MSMMWVGIAGLVLSAGSTAYGMSKSRVAANKAADLDMKEAEYNAQLDLAAAAQLDLDTLQNVKTMRQEAKVYLSKQEASYAAAGVLATTGSPLASMITSAGRFEQRIQQTYQDSQQKQQSYAIAARHGRLEGAGRAEADRMQGTIAQINGYSKIAGSVFNAYESGTFSGGGGGGDPLKGTTGLF